MAIMMEIDINSKASKLGNRLSEELWDQIDLELQNIIWLAFGGRYPGELQIQILSQLKDDLHDGN